MNIKREPDGTIYFVSPDGKHKKPIGVVYQVNRWEGGGYNRYWAAAVSFLVQPAQPREFDTEIEAVEALLLRVMHEIDMVSSAIEVQNSHALCSGWRP